jgi:resolvase domain protein
MEKIYSVSEFAEMIGKSVNTLQRWDRLGILTSYRSPMSRRYYIHPQYNEYMGINKSEDKKNVIYTRVSNIGQKEEEMIQDLTSVIHVFSCRIYSLQKYKSKIKKVLDSDD